MNKMEKELSSIEWFLDKVMDMIHESNHAELSKIYQQAKAMHKEEYIDAWMNGHNEIGYSRIPRKKLRQIAEEDYNETFN